MRSTLLAVLTGVLAFVAIGVLSFKLETGSIFGASPYSLLQFQYSDWHQIATAFVRSANATVPAFLGGWLLSASSKSWRMSVSVGLTVALIGLIAQSMLNLMGNGFSFSKSLSEIWDVASLYLIGLPLIGMSFSSAVAAYAGMRQR